MFFALLSVEVALLILAVIGGATALGYAIGHYLRQHEANLREPFGVLQAALLGLVGLILAFGLSLAVGRYEDRRAASALVTLLLLVTFDLDRPTRRLIRVPATPLTALRASMLLPPAASGASYP